MRFDLTLNRKFRPWIMTLLLCCMVAMIFMFKSNDKKISLDSLSFARVQQGNVANKVKGFAKFVALDNRHLTSPFRTTVKSLNYRTGDLVKTGDELLTLTNHEVERRLQEAEIDWRQSILSKGKAELEWQQKVQQQQGLIHRLTSELALQNIETSAKKKLFRQNIVSALENETAKLSLIQADNNLNLAKAELERLKKQQTQAMYLESNSVELAKQRLDSRHADAQRLVIRAPFSGKLDELNLAVGQTIAEGGLLAAIKGESRFVLRAKVPQRHSSQILIGQKAEFMLSNKVHTAQVRSILPGVKQGFIEVELDIPEQIKGVKEDLEVGVNLVVGVTEAAKYVQKPSGVLSGQNVTVFVKHTDRLIRTQLHVKAIQDDIMLLAENSLPIGSQVLMNDSQDWLKYDSLSLEDE